MVQEGFTMTLITVAVLLTGASVVMFALWFWESLAKQFFVEVQGESEGGVKGAGSVAVRRLGMMNRRFMWPGYETRTRKKLIKAGDPQSYAPEDIMALQEIGLIGGLLFGVMFCNAFNFNFAWSLLVALIGVWFPLQWLSDQVKKRHLAISRALPYNLDLLTLSVEAGLDFAAALGKVVEKGKHGPLREELQMVLKQLKMGKTREESLKSMVARVDLPPLTTFVTALVQADKMGTSLGKVLRIQSTQLRIERTQRAEKLANEAPVKMLFPLIACIFPTVFMILFGPIVFALMYGDRVG